VFYSEKVSPVCWYSRLDKDCVAVLGIPQRQNFKGRIEFVWTPKSGLFLLGSCVAAIAAVGSVFELSSGQPDLGVGPTGAVLALSIPLVGIFFYAAVKDARANM
jgi:hypothetical protein